MSERDLFIAALEKSDSERASWLANACAGDDSLRLRVEVLLRAHDRASRFLAAPAVEQFNFEAITANRPTHTADGTNWVGNDMPLDFLSPAEKPDQLGKLGDYEILEVVGRGGMGVVLKAFEPKLHRLVAIKVMAPHLAANPAARRRFEREAKAVAAVRNEHVVAIHAVQSDGANPYLAMEFIGGVSLQERLDQRGPMDVKEILRIGQQAALGLAAAHDQGLVHRDVKPANILLENGVERVKLTDFGLARAVDDASITQSGTITGTPNFMSPEQADGKPIDHRSDLFSLGSVLYAMATGHPPFRADGVAAVLKRVAADAPRPVREINSDIPDWLDAIIRKLHAKDPAHRFQSAKEVADLLGQHLAHLQQPAVVPMPKPVANVYSGPKLPSMGKVPDALVVLGLSFTVLAYNSFQLLCWRQSDFKISFGWVAGVGVIAFTTFFMVLSIALFFRQTRRPVARTLLFVVTAVATGYLAFGLTMPPDWFRWWQSSEPVDDRAQFAANWNRDLIKRVTIECDGKIVEEYDGKAIGVGTMLSPGAYTIRGFKNDREVYREEFYLEPGKSRAIDIFESPQSAAYAPLRIDCATVPAIVAVDGPGLKSEIQLAGGTAGVTQGLKVGVRYKLVVSKGDQLIHTESIRLESGERRELRIGNVVFPERGVQLKPKNRGFPNDVMQVQIAPDYKSVAVGRLDGPILVFDAATGKERFTISRFPTEATAFGFTPNSSQIAFVTDTVPGERVIRFAAIADGAAVGRDLKTLHGELVNSRALAFSPDGKRLVVSSAHGFDPADRFRSRIHCWELPAGKEVPPLEWQEGTTEQMQFTADGAEVLAVTGIKYALAWKWTSGKVDRRLESNFALDVLTAGTEWHAVAGWSESLGKAAVLTWPPESLREPPWPSPPQYSVRFACLAISPDGRLIAAGNKGVADAPWEKRAAIRVWDTKTGAEKAVLLGHTDWILDLVFSPDGKGLISASKDGTVRSWKLP
jgi:serine/threonine protein kinase/WD40 repeat protein